MADSGSPPRSRWRKPAEVGAVLVLGAILGWTARDWFGPGPDSPPAPQGAAATGMAEPAAPLAAPTAKAGRNADSSRFWAATALALAARTGRIEALLDEIEAGTGDPRDSLERAIAESSDRELATIVSAVTRIDEDELLTEGDLRPFASRLVDVALDGLDGPSKEPEPPRRVVFTGTTRDFDRDASSQTRFPADQGRIFAMIELDDHDGSRVLVKWLNEDTKRVHSLQSMTYDPSQPLWSFLARDGDWDRGRYEVSFYSQDAEMTLLGRGAFTIF